MLYQTQPPNSRLLLQLIDARSEEDALRELVDTFGPEKAEKAMLVRGTMHPVIPRHHAGIWVARSQGFRAYVPITEEWSRNRNASHQPRTSGLFPGSRPLPAVRRCLPPS